MGTCGFLGQYILIIFVIVCQGSRWMKKYLLYFILAISIFPTYGQKTYIIRGQVDLKRERIVKSHKIDEVVLEKLAYKITRNSRTDKEKLSDIYLWIASNISYDHELARNKDLQRSIYTSEANVVSEVLRRKMALCGGFSFLLRDLCYKLGIESEVIHGYTKSYSDLDRREMPHHTWNAVYLEGEWKLIDITWAIGHGESDNPDSFWFLTSPEEFIRSHYPEDVRWTLLENPISFTEFQKPIGE